MQRRHGLLVPSRSSPRGAAAASRNSETLLSAKVGGGTSSALRCQLLVHERHGGAVLVASWCRAIALGAVTGLSCQTVRAQPIGPHAHAGQSAVSGSTRATRCATSQRLLRHARPETTLGSTAPPTDGEWTPSRGPSAGTQTTRPQQQIKGTRGPRAIHLDGLTRASVRRRRTAFAFSSARAAFQDRQRLHVMEFSRTYQ
jgi:hypothetical protein